MNPNGYVKVYRSLCKKGYYSKSEYVHLWVHLLIKATYTNREYLFNGKIEKLKPGQFITGRNALARETAINSSKVERILKCFENEHQIEQQANNKFRIITILNWDRYQNCEQQSEQPVNSQRTASEQPANTNNKDNKEKKDKKDKNPPTPLKKQIEIPGWLDKTLWSDFLEHRNKLRKSMTPKAKELFISKLNGLRLQGYDPKELIETAIERGWQTVFEPKDQQPKKHLTDWRQEYNIQSAQAFLNRHGGEKHETE